MLTVDAELMDGKLESRSLLDIERDTVCFDILEIGVESAEFHFIKL